MKKEMTNILDYYDREVINLMIQKYNLSPMDAFKMFITSNTYKMLCNEKLEMWDFGPKVIFEIFETEKITGSPKNSIYLR